MKKKIKKILLKKISIPNPESLISKKAILLILVLFSFVYDLLIFSYPYSFPKFNPAINSEKTITPFEKEIKNMVSGYPIERMATHISKKEKKTAAFLVGIAKKESNWGKYSPKLDGKDCYNYWGYRGQSENITPSGYTCFGSPREAVNVVGKRISTLINDSNLSTPEKMIVWKCGFSCAEHSPESVSKWIADVDLYYNKIYQ